MHDLDVGTTPSTRTGELGVRVDGRRIGNERLPLLRPIDEKVLGAVEDALGR